MPARKSSRRGAAGIAALLLFLLLGAMVLTLAAATTRQSDLVEPRVQSLRAFYAAEAGQQLAIRELVLQTDEDGDGVIGGISDDEDPSTHLMLAGVRFAVTSVGTGRTRSLRADAAAGGSLRSVELDLAPASNGEPAGFILREIWRDITGIRVSDLTSDAAYDASPDESDTLTAFETPINEDEQFGARIIGMLHPPATGEYVFWLASDDYGELWLSTDESAENVSLIASVPGWTRPRVWDKYGAQESAPIALVEGQQYFIYAVYKERTGGDHLAVAWSGPGIARQVIPGAYLSPP